MIFAQDLMGFVLAITYVTLALAQVFSMVRLVLGPTSGDRIL
ncbi:MAG: multicomponent K+:H+ antiporter subunit F, partial [Dinoroseobacter sp.]